MRRGREIALALGSLALALVAIELGLRTFSQHPVAGRSNRIADPMLRWRMEPALPEIDAHGFPNPEGLERAEIAVLGDSFAYGFNAPASESWPRRLERESGRSVYNFGVGGFGVLEYWYLLDEALALQPKRVFASLYLSNDLSDVCPRLAEKVEWREWLDARGVEPLACPAPAQRPRRVRTEKHPLGAWLAGHSALGSLIDVASAEPRVALAVAVGGVDDAFVVDEPGLRAVIPLRRLRGIRERTDLARPDVAAGFAVARAFFTSARERSAAQGARFGVLLIPSKERVFARRIAASAVAVPASYTEAVQSEDAVTAAVADELHALGVPAVDARPQLERMLDEVGAFYPLRRDDHPFAPGYRALAVAAAELLSMLDAQQAPP